MTIPQAGRNPGMIFGVESSIDCQDQPTLHGTRLPLGRKHPAGVGNPLHNVILMLSSRGCARLT